MAWRSIGDETVLVHLETHRCFGLNEAGAAVWTVLGASESVRDESEKSTVPERLPDPVLGFLGALEERGLIETTQDTRSLHGLKNLELKENPQLMWDEELGSMVNDSEPAQFDESCLYLPMPPP